MSETLKNIITDDLSVQQSIIGTAMLTGNEKATTDYTIHNGVHHNSNPMLRQHEKEQLAAEFKKDPNKVLSRGRDALIEISADDKLSPEEKSKRLDRYLDAYFDMTVAMDHSAFPPTPEGRVGEGVPSYIPDGFIDMGGDNLIDSRWRSREQILVDKRNVLAKYKPFIKQLMGPECLAMPADKREKYMVQAIARSVYNSVQYNEDFQPNIPDNKKGGVFKLSELGSGVCRHHALIVQVLCQAVGVECRVLKNHVQMPNVYGRHAANMVKTNGQWYLVDATNPDWETDATNRKKWRLATYAVDGPPSNGEEKKYHVKSRFNDGPREYTSHNNMYWRVHDMSKKAS